MAARKKPAPKKAAPKKPAPKKPAPKKPAPKKAAAEKASTKKPASKKLSATAGNLAQARALVESPSPKLFDRQPAPVFAGRADAELRCADHTPRELNAKELAEKKEIFLRVLEATGVHRLATERAGVAYGNPYGWRDLDADFAAKWARAKKIAATHLEDEAWRRAMEGTEKPVHYRGEKVDTIVEYSDSLLQFLLRGNDPEKYGTSRHEHTGKGGAPIQYEDLTPEERRAKIEQLRYVIEGGKLEDAKK